MGVQSASFLVLAILVPQLLAQLGIGLRHRGFAQLPCHDIIIAAVRDIRRNRIRAAATLGAAAVAATAATAIAALTGGVAGAGLTLALLPLARLPLALTLAAVPLARAAGGTGIVATRSILRRGTGTAIAAVA